MDIIFENINKYIDYYKLKQNFLAELCGFSENKLSRILRGEQKKISYDEMKKISESLGKDLSFFSQKGLKLKKEKNFANVNIAFFMSDGHAISSEQEKIANDVFTFLESVNEKLGVEKSQNNYYIEANEVWK